MRERQEKISARRRNQYIAEHFGDLSSDSAKPDNDSAEARYRGWRAGRETEINSGVEGGSAGMTEVLPIGETKLLN